MTTLELSGNIRRLSAESHIHVLKNTPGLNTLKLHCMTYSMDDFEFIHSQLSSLKSLSVTAEINATAIKLLSELNLVKHLESFKIIGQWYYKFAWLRPMTMIKELDINSGINSEMDNDSTDLRITVNDIMDMCGPHIQSIIFRGGVFSYNMKPQDDILPVFNQIKKFEFDNIKLLVNIGTIISICFPQLHTLRFNNCFGREDFANREIHLIWPYFRLQ
jgi:hypothetical protein